jgi:hypothetical protein
MNDVEHLRLLSIFHYVVGGLMGLFSLFPLIHLALGLAMVSGALNTPGQQGPPPAFGWIFVVIPAAFILLGMTTAICIAVAGYKLATHTGHLFCLVIAGMFMPFGTVLGVFTIIVLVQPSVKQLFGQTVD